MEEIGISRRLAYAIGGDGTLFVGRMNSLFSAERAGRAWPVEANTNQLQARQPCVLPFEWTAAWCRLSIGLVLR